MLLSTTNQIEGHPIREYKGIVAAQTIIGANVFKDIMASLRDFFGGRSRTYEEVFAKAKDTVLEELADEVRRAGGNAAVGVKLDYETVGAGSMLMVCAVGTAVVI